MDIVSCCEEWARWLAQRNFHGWPSKTVLGRCLDDMPTTKCTTCNGKGRLQGHEVGSTHAFLTCDVCKGKGKVPMASTASKINPAMIASTEKHGYIPKVQFNFLAHKVDLVVQNTLTDRQRGVIYLEYQEPGSQYRKAHLLGMKMPLYKLHLGQAHRLIQVCLNAR